MCQSSQEQKIRMITKEDALAYLEMCKKGALNDFLEQHLFVDDFYQIGRKEESSK